MKMLMIFLTLGLVLACSTQEEASQPVIEGEELVRFWHPSMTAVLAKPEEYVGTYRVLFGYLYRPPNSPPLLFLSKDHALFLDYSSSITLGSTTGDSFEQCEDGYARVWGTLERSHTMSVIRGLRYTVPQVRAIHSVQEGGEATECWPPNKRIDYRSR